MFLEQPEDRFDLYPFIPYGTVPTVLKDDVMEQLMERLALYSIIPYGTVPTFLKDDVTEQLMELLALYSIIPYGTVPTFLKDDVTEQLMELLALYSIIPYGTVPTFLKDDVMEQLMERLGLTIPEYSPDLDPVRQLKQGRVPEIGTYNTRFPVWRIGNDIFRNRVHPQQMYRIPENRTNKKELKSWRSIFDSHDHSFHFFMNFRRLQKTEERT